MYKQQKKFVTGANFPIFKVKPFHIKQITWHQKYQLKKYISNLHSDFVTYHFSTETKLYNGSLFRTTH